MRQAMLSALATAVLALAAPGIAMAGHGHHHHKGKAKGHHARVHLEHFGAPVPNTASNPSTSDEGTSGETPSSTTSEDAGTVMSFTEGVLTIKLQDGSTVSGKVTSRTEIECTGAPTANPADERSTSEDKSSGDEEKSEDGQPAQEGSHQDGGDSGEDGGQPAASPEAPCDSSALKEGAVVREAELKVSSSGDEFVSIELVR